jgi:hypothetical protein
MITSDKDGSGAKAPPPLITRPLVTTNKNERDHYSNRNSDSCQLWKFYKSKQNTTTQE